MRVSNPGAGVSDPGLRPGFNPDGAPRRESLKQATAPSTRAMTPQAVASLAQQIQVQGSSSLIIESWMKPRIPRARSTDSTLIRIVSMLELILSHSFAVAAYTQH